MVSEDAGRRWESAIVDGSPNFHAGIAIDSRKGVLVGGRIQPYSHRSVGTVHVTQDGGRRWRALESVDLPRLTGIQKLGNEEWIAWGDWSPTLGSAVFETYDAGVTWAGKPLAASHVQTSAWENSQSGIVVDRLSRVFRMEAGKEPQLLSVGGDASNPILKAKFDLSGWWLIGESAQIYHSVDGYHWQSKSLPGNAMDRSLIRLNDIAFQAMLTNLMGSNAHSLNTQRTSDEQSNLHLTNKTSTNTRCWVAGSPGSVVWMSDDLGNSWKVQLTSQHMPIQSIAHAGDATLFAGAKLGTLLGTRNAGEGWWILDREGERLALLSFAAVQETIPWDALTVTARETRAHTSSIVLHSQQTYQLAGPWCEKSTRASIVASELGCAGVDTYSHAPITSLSDNRQPSELAIYDSKNAIHSNAEFHVRKIVSNIRQYRPDVVVCDSVDASDPLVQQAGRAVMTARNRASDSRYVCFSKESGIPDSVWDSKTLLARAECDNDSNQRRSELRFASTTPIHREGTLLSDLLLNVSALVDSQEIHDLQSDHFVSKTDSMLPWNGYGEYTVLLGLRPSGGKNGLLPEAVRQPGSMRSKTTKDSVAYRELIVNLQRELTIKKIIEIEVEEATNDSRWKTALQNAMRSTAKEAKSHSIWHIAQEARARSQWNRWSTCMDILIGEYPSDGAAELASIQRAAWGNSSEVKLWRQQQDQLKNAEPMSSSVVSASFVTTSSSSPFDHKNSSERSIQDYPRAMSEPRQPSRSTLQGQLASKIVSPVRTASSVEMVGTKNNESHASAMSTSFASTVSTAFQRMESDPRTILLGLRRQTDIRSEVPPPNTDENHPLALANDNKLQVSYASQMAALKKTLTQMSNWYGLYGWSALADDEYSSRLSNHLIGRSGTNLGLTSNFTNSSQSIWVPQSKLRPILDGELEDEIWKRAFAMQLRSSWDGTDKPANVTNQTKILCAHDDRFLYVAGVCPFGSLTSNVSSPSGENATQRNHDISLHGADRVCIRIDTDRDFLTWFQFSIDSQGNLEDSLNDLKAWNPRWYATSAMKAHGWNFEIAIPLAELLDSQQVALLSHSTHSDTPSAAKSALKTAAQSIGPIDPVPNGQNPLERNLVSWNISVDRQTPDRTAEQSKPMFIEDFSPVSWHYALVEKPSSESR